MAVRVRVSSCPALKWLPHSSFCMLRHAVQTAKNLAFGQVFTLEVSFRK
jgi:hypothetical protein